MWKLISLVVFIHLIISLENCVNSLKTNGLNDTSSEIVGGDAHECYRICKKGEKKKCFYQFTLTQDTAMSVHCKNCPVIKEDCFLKGCITAGGNIRLVSVANHMLPGPSIQVCEGDTVQVSVINHFHSDSTTIHWHGIHQKNNNFMDGVPYVTQCPILPHNKFVYEFEASPAGSHIWHSHIGFQEADGLFGSLIVRKSNDALSKYYDFDLAEHVMVIWQWYEVPTKSKLTIALHKGNAVYGYGFLVNGLASHASFYHNNQTFQTPRKIFNVDVGKRYRFRVLYNSQIFCPVQVSIDNHELLMIASETGVFDPLKVDSFIINAGERYDFVFEANQKPKDYYIKYRGLGDCNKDHVKVSDFAILHYNGVENTKPYKKIAYEEAHRQGVLLNPAELFTENYINNSLITFVNLNNSNAIKDDIEGHPDHTFYYQLTFNIYNSYFIPGPYPQINNIGFEYPTSPLVSQPNETSETNICYNGNQTNKKCLDTFCTCLSIYKVKKDSLVEMIFFDTSKLRDQDHPMHLHGHDYYVVSMEHVGSKISLEYVKERNEKGLIRKKFNRPPVKDNISVPTKGFAIIRFRAKNPGYWFFHCHLANHMEMGMNFILKVGEDSEIPKTPMNFPKCVNFDVY